MANKAGQTGLAYFDLTGACKLLNNNKAIIFIMSFIVNESASSKFNKRSGYGAV